MKNFMRVVSFIFILAAITIVAPALALTGGGSECDQSPFCEKFNSPGNQGTIDLSEIVPESCSVESFKIKAGTQLFSFEETSDDGCYLVTFREHEIAWDKYSGGSSCKDVSHIQVWFSCVEEDPTATPTQTPTATIIEETEETLEDTPTLTPTLTPFPTIPKVTCVVGEGTCNSGNG